MAINQARQHVHSAGVISFTPLAGRFDSLTATLGKPTLLISLIRLFSMTMSTGPGRSARAVDHRRAANDQPLERPFAFAGFAIRGGGD